MPHSGVAMGKWVAEGKGGEGGGGDEALSRALDREEEEGKEGDSNRDPGERGRRSREVEGKKEWVGGETAEGSIP